MQPHIRSGLLTAYQPTVLALGGNPQRAIESAGADKDVFDNPESFIPYATYLELLHRAAQITGCPHFGLEMGSTLGAANMGVTGFILSQGASVAEAWETFARFYHVHDTYGHVRFHTDADLAYVSYAIPDHTVRGARQSVDIAVTIVVNCLRMMVGDEFRAITLDLPYPQPEDLTPYAGLPVAELRFDRVPFALGFDRRLATAPVIKADPGFQRILSDYLARLNASDQHRVAARVETMIREFLPTGQCNLQGMARFLHVSPRTLQNHLAAEHTSFQLLLERVRREMAEEQLRNREVRLVDIAQLLGYSELSAFSRGFKRWHGCSPREWRNRQLQFLRL